MKKKIICIAVIAMISGLMIIGCEEKSPSSNNNQTPTENPIDSNKPSEPLIEPEMIFVERGTFTMGNIPDRDGPGTYYYDEEKPVHTVSLSSFHIGKYEVTQLQWKAVMGSNPSHFKGDNLPVENVSWDSVQVFISRLNAATGKSYRLPTEAEWEYVARGGNQSFNYKYSGSNNIDEIAWYYNNSNDKTHPVGTKKANELGIYDMNGNVREWCQDWYGAYSPDSQTNPAGPFYGSNRVVRGGGWNYNGVGCRIAARGNNPPDYHYENLGFRLVLP
jgi:formylglycine-generating enzyme required for sulfatase activity